MCNITVAVERALISPRMALVQFIFCLKLIFNNCKISFSFVTCGHLRIVKSVIFDSEFYFRHAASSDRTC